jgi:hypothetical protein
MKHADFEGKKNNNNNKICPTLVQNYVQDVLHVLPLSFQHLLYNFYFFFFSLFYHFGNEIKDFLKLLQLRVGKKMPSKFALLKQHVFAHYEVQQTWVFATCITH